ncbi:MAG: hypothetical protein ABI696_01985, partial [Rubrivivax sp.]
AVRPAAQRGAMLPSLVERLRARGLEPGGAAPLTTWSHAVDRARLAPLRALIAAAQRWAVERLGVALPLHLAVLPRADWDALITWQPYGIPGVAGQPAVVFMPAGDDGLAAEDALALVDRWQPSTRAALAADGIDPATAARRYVDLVGLHELGHVFVGEIGLRPVRHWLNEWLASFVGYAFLREHMPAQARVWDTVLQGYVDAIPAPRHRSLADFDRLYFGVGARNYIWYQAQFQQRVREVHARDGIGFVDALRRAGLALGPAADDPGSGVLLAALEAITPGWQAWAARIGRDPSPAGG